MAGDKVLYECEHDALLSVTEDAASRNLYFLIEGEWGTKKEIQLWYIFIYIYIFDGFVYIFTFQNVFIF